jgi:hypothetical protein
MEGDAEGVICEEVNLCLMIYRVAAQGDKARLQVSVIGTFHLNTLIGYRVLLNNFL